MKATEENITARPIHEDRLWQRCAWQFDGKDIFIENTLTLYSFFEHVTSEFWLNGWQHTPEALLDAIEAHGLDPSKYQAREEFYGDGFFPACASMEDALNYHNAISCGFSGEELALITK